MKFLKVNFLSKKFFDINSSFSFFFIILAIPELLKLKVKSKLFVLLLYMSKILWNVSWLLISLLKLSLAFFFEYGNQLTSSIIRHPLSFKNG